MSARRPAAVWSPAHVVAPAAGLLAFIAPGLLLAADASPVTAGRAAQMLAALAVVLAAFLGSVWLARRLSVGRLAAGRRLRIVEGLAVGARERLLLVAVDDVEVLVGVAPGRVEALELPQSGGRTDFAARLAEAVAPRAPAGGVTTPSVELAP